MCECNIILFHSYASFDSIKFLCFQKFESIIYHKNSCNLTCIDNRNQNNINEIAWHAI